MSWPNCRCAWAKRHPTPRCFLPIRRTLEPPVRFGKKFHSVHFIPNQPKDTGPGEFVSRKFDPPGHPATRRTLASSLDRTLTAPGQPAQNGPHGRPVPSSKGSGVGSSSCASLLSFADVNVSVDRLEPKLRPAAVDRTETRFL